MTRKIAINNKKSENIQRFLYQIESTVKKNNIELEEDFNKSLAGDYLKMLKDEYEYQSSEEAIIETIEANEYEFTADGELF